MHAGSRLQTLAAAGLLSLIQLAGALPALGQSPPPADPGVVPDDELTLVVGTRFVAPSAEGTTVKAQFDQGRIALSEFNETDRCIDNRALAMAQDYFNSLGRMLGKAGLYYLLPDAEVGKLASECEKSQGRPPQAWVDQKTKIIAFGRVVPTADAAALERSIR